jgi:hypothetical protein
MSFDSWGSGGQSETDTSLSQSRYDEDEEEDIEAHESHRVKPQLSSRTYEQKTRQRPLPGTRTRDSWGDLPHRSRGDLTHDRSSPAHTLLLHFVLSCNVGTSKI